MSRRTERLASAFQREIATIIMRELHDPRIKLSPSVTRVKVAEDLSTADVYVTIMGTPGEQSAAFHALQHSAGMIRSRLAKDFDIRQMPYIRFHIDQGARREVEMLELLHKIELERQAQQPPSPADSDPSSPQNPDPDSATDPSKT